MRYSPPGRRAWRLFLPLLLTACRPESPPTPAEAFPAGPSPQVEAAPQASPAAAETPLRFAVIGDYGTGGQGEREVADLVLGWQPDLILTTGDNNYPDGSAGTIEWNIGHFYGSYIHTYGGPAGEGSPFNRFFPTLGNHDWVSADADAYLDYFDLPGNERYYDFVWGPVHFFALDSDVHEPDGISTASPQAAWLQEGLARSTAAWQVVYFHHPPYSSGYHGSTWSLRWPFAEWGADAVFSGHDHSYERLQVDGIPHFVVGLGGAARYDFYYLLPESRIRYSADLGALLVSADPKSLLFEFYSVRGELVDRYAVTH